MRTRSGGIGLTASPPANGCHPSGMFFDDEFGTETISMHSFVRDLTLISIVAMATVSLAADAEKPAPAKTDAGDWDAMRGIGPRGYVCHFTRRPIEIDGKADESA